MHFMNIKTQDQRIREKLQKDGVISNIWAIDHYILRLSERIRELKEVGWNIKAGGFKKKNGKKTKEYEYFLVGRGKI